MLFGSAFFVISGIGPLLVAGPLVAWIVGAVEGAVVVGGLSAIGAGLYSIGIPKNSIVEYETALMNLISIHQPTYAGKKPPCDLAQFGGAYLRRAKRIEKVFVIRHARRD